MRIYCKSPERIVDNLRHSLTLIVNWNFTNLNSFQGTIKSRSIQSNKKNIQLGWNFFHHSWIFPSEWFKMKFYVINHCAETITFGSSDTSIVRLNPIKTSRAEKIAKHFWWTLLSNFRSALFEAFLRSDVELKFKASTKAWNSSAAANECSSFRFYSRKFVQYFKSASSFPAACHGERQIFLFSPTLARWKKRCNRKRKIFARSLNEASKTPSEWNVNRPKIIVILNLDCDCGKVFKSRIVKSSNIKLKSF